MNAFKKAERLRSKKAIERLFRDGKAFNHYPFKVIWHEMPLPTPYPAQVLITVSRKKFSNAADRNRIRRILREAYRHNTDDFYKFLTIHEKQCALAIVYRGNSIPDFRWSMLKIKALIRRLTEGEMNP